MENENKVESSEASIFNNADQEVSSVEEFTIENKKEINSSTEQDQIPEELKEYVGEGKKYRNLSDIHKAFPNAQKHIQTLESRLQEATEELNRRKTAEDLIEDMKTGLSQKDDTNLSPEINQDYVTKLVDNILASKLTAKVASENAQKVVNTFKNVYGEKAKDAYLNLAKELQTSTEELDRISKTNPSMLLRLANIKETVPTRTGKLASDTITMTQTGNQEISAKVGKYPTSKDLARAWRSAGEIVKKELNI